MRLALNYQLRNVWNAAKDQKRAFSVYLKHVILLTLVVGTAGCKKFDSGESEVGQVAAKASARTSTGGDNFIIAVLPDTQTYVDAYGNNIPNPEQNAFSGLPQMYYEQTQWIADNAVDSNIVYVAHLGDISQDGDNSTTQWIRSDSATQKLDLINIPYGMAVGNHDQKPRGYLTGTTSKYNQYYGVTKFSGKPWYGGHYGSNNDSHYDLFSAGGLNFVVIYAEYDSEYMEDATNTNTWIYNLLITYNTRKAIIVTHYLGNPDDHASAPNAFSTQGAAIYAKIKSQPNVIAMLGGHVDGEGYRQDTYLGKTVKSMISDYQFKPWGGDGYMRLMKFSVADDRISVSSFSPYRKNRDSIPYYKTDANSYFTRPLFRNYTTSRKEDFDNDGKTELSLFNNGIWKVSGMSNVTYGTLAGDWPIPSDYNGDGKTDIGIYRSSNYTFNVPALSGSQIFYGTAGDIPVPADYNGDGKAGIALYRPGSAATWHIPEYSSSQITYGVTGDIPVPADYDGDGKVDIAIYRPGGSAQWYIRNVLTKQFGSTNYIPAPGDYNGDGIADLCVYNPATGTWHITGVTISIPDVTAIVTPVAGDIPAPGDYFGAGKVQPAIYRPSNQTLYMYNNGVVTTTVLGATGDKLLNLPFAIRRVFFP